MAEPPIRASDAERDERLGAALICLWAADVGARDPLIVGDSDAFWPIVPIVASGVAILAERRPRRPRLTA